MKIKIANAILFAVTIVSAGDVLAGGGGFVKDKIETTCGEYKVVIECGKALPNDVPDGRVCVRNTLKFISPNGAVHIPPTPKNLLKGSNYDRTPISIECELGADERAYVLVNFSGEKFLCGSCMAYDLFTSSGVRLTTNSKSLDKFIRQNRLSRGIKLVIEETDE
jgi:hypothetical protein